MTTTASDDEQTRLKPYHGTLSIIWSTKDQNRNSARYMHTFMHAPGLIVPEEVGEKHIYSQNEQYSRLQRTITQILMPVVASNLLPIYGLFWSEETPLNLERPSLLIMSDVFKALSDNDACEWADTVASTLCKSFEGAHLPTTMISSIQYDFWNLGDIDHILNDHDYAQAWSTLEKHIIASTLRDPTTHQPGITPRL